MRGPGDVAGHEDVAGDHPVDVERAAAGVATHAPEPGSQPGPLEPLDVADDPNDVTTTSTSSVLPSESRARRTCPPASPSSASTETPVRRSTPAARCISAAIAPITPPSGPHSGAGPRSVTVTSSPSSRHTEATSDPMNPEPMISTRRGRAASAACSRAASVLVRTVWTPCSAASSALGHRRARTPVAISRRSPAHLAAVGEPHQLVGPVQGGRGDTESPLRIHRAQPRQLRMIGGHPPLEDLLGQRRPVIRLAGLVADDGQLPAKTLFPQRFGGTQPGQRSADDDDAALVLEAVRALTRGSAIRRRACRR